MTFPSNQTILNESYRKACRRKVPHRGHTAHPAAEDDHVELFTGHIYPTSDDRSVQVCMGAAQPFTTTPLRRTIEWPLSLQRRGRWDSNVRTGAVYQPRLGSCGI